MKYGFIPPILESDNYVLGGWQSLPKVILQPDGQWDKYLPEYEPQFENGYDTYGCTVWGTENAIEILMKRLDVNANYSEKYIYNAVPVRPPGGDPHSVAEAIREVGMIPDEPTPLTFTEFCTPTPPSDADLKKGGEWTDKYTFGHEYVFTNVDKKTRIALMKEALQYSPLGVSVTAWYQEDGIYIDRGQTNNHWCVVYGYEEKNGKTYFKVFDSYDHSLKVLHPDHTISYCKRYSITKKKTEEEKVNWLIALIKSVVAMIKPQTKVPDVIPAPYSPSALAVPPTPVKSPRERLYEAAVACLGTDASPNDAAPDELGCMDTVNQIYFKAFGEHIETPGISTTRGFAAMVDRADKFVRVTDTEPGNIIISPTGLSKFGDYGPIKNGHVGIFGKGNTIMSNSSATGKFEENYTLDTWIERYRKKGGYPIFFIKCI